ncbi:hypothetical protein EYF80_041778 [Liparis tanakae]|uniref:Uncharacterized protein n=1 Tax=Liparis tanakae TaxID=230148 RepID=A0A4Z2G355_9TELE|nr:hypothetical protein EYF80_041778 [Liparis tanakae]
MTCCSGEHRAGSEWDTLPISCELTSRKSHIWLESQKFTTLNYTYWTLLCDRCNVGPHGLSLRHGHHKYSHIQNYDDSNRGNKREHKVNTSCDVMGDGDDDQQVERGSVQRDERQQNVNKDAIRLRFPAGLVEEEWKAELRAFSRLHPAYIDDDLTRSSPGGGPEGDCRRKALRGVGRSTGISSWGTGHRRDRGLEPAGMVAGHWELEQDEMTTGHWEPESGKGGDSDGTVECGTGGTTGTAVEYHRAGRNRKRRD